MTNQTTPKIMESIVKILNLANTKETNIQPTLLYNEGWMLRLVLNWLANNPDFKYEGLSIPDDCSWFSEALLPSPFLRSETGREGYTHADGVVGKFCIGCSKDSNTVSNEDCSTRKFCPAPESPGKNKGKLSLKPDCDFFYVIEAKMGSSLSAGITNDQNYNQAARSIACIAELLIQQDLTEQTFDKLGFYVFLPEIKKEKIEKTIDPKSIKKAILTRIGIPDNDSAKWLESNLDNFVAKIDINAITWEEILRVIGDSSLSEFYVKCKTYNGINKKSQKSMA